MRQATPLRLHSPYPSSRTSAPPILFEPFMLRIGCDVTGFRVQGVRLCDSHRRKSSTPRTNLAMPWRADLLIFSALFWTSLFAVAGACRDQLCSAPLLLTVGAAITAFLCAESATHSNRETSYRSTLLHLELEAP